MTEGKAPQTDEGGDSAHPRAAAESGGAEAPGGEELTHWGAVEVVPAELGTAARLLRGAQNLFFTVVLLAMVVLGLLPILARFGVPVNASWAEPLMHQMVLWLALSGAAAATAGRKHISVDAVSHFLPRSLATGLRVLTSLVAAGVSGVLTWVSVAFVRGEAEYAVAGRGILGAPEWCWQLALPIGFSMLTLSLLLAVWREIRSLMPSKTEGRSP